MGFLEIKDLKVHYPVRSGFLNRTTEHIAAVDGISLEIAEGKTYGLVGESGSGKSTIGKAIIGLERITSGNIYYNGEDVTNKAKRRTSDYTRNVQMIFQDAMSSLNPKKQVQDIITEPLRNFEKMSLQEEKKLIVELLNVVGMSEDTLNKYPHEFSGGQRQRIGIARAMATKPKLIIADEPVSALDLSVQAELLNYMKRIQDEYNVSYLFISHDLGVMKHMCDELAVMYRGRFVEYGNKKDIYTNPQHHCTKRLLSAIPIIDPVNRESNKRKRMAVESEYQRNQELYYDENGRIYDLKTLTSTHEVAFESVSKRGG